MNNVSLIGRLGRDPQVKFTGTGKAVANFSIAVDYGFGEKKTTSWIPVVAWEKTAELAQQYLTTGSQVAVEGRLQVRSWEDKNGNKRSTMEVIATRIDFLTKKEKSASAGGSDQEAAPAPSNEFDEEAPF